MYFPTSQRCRRFQSRTNRVHIRERSLTRRGGGGDRLSSSFHRYRRCLLRLNTSNRRRIPRSQVRHAAKPHVTRIEGNTTSPSPRASVTIELLCPTITSNSPGCHDASLDRATTSITLMGPDATSAAALATVPNVATASKIASPNRAIATVRIDFFPDDDDDDDDDDGEED
ncbi:hypothetical protein ACHAXA_006092 [Cyclostephanos tholiformis]|uniref:Uncharacterized protein n=1 Tax=Cyclostephanos tholiformis TaxID=382380 RepID=A0ABD3SAY4_9STRA